MGNFIKATYHAITQSCKLTTLSKPYKAVLTDFAYFRRSPYPRSLASACSARAAVRRVLFGSHSCSQENGRISVPFLLAIAKISVVGCKRFVASSAIHHLHECCAHMLSAIDRTNLYSHFRLWEFARNPMFHVGPGFDYIVTSAGLHLQESGCHAKATKSPPSGNVSASGSMCLTELCDTRMHWLHCSTRAWSDM